MIFLDRTGLGKQISLQLTGAQQEVIEVIPGTSFRRVRRGEYSIRPGVREDYDALLVDLRKREQLPSRVIHLWSVHEEGASLTLDQAITLVFSSAVYLAKAFSSQHFTDVDIAIVSNRLHSVSGESIVLPSASALLGLTSVIPKEFPKIICRNIDIDMSNQGAGYLGVQIITELAATFTNPVVAYRGGERWVERVERATASSTQGIAVLESNYVSSPVSATTSILPEKRSIDEMQFALTGWWQKLLGIDLLGLDDDFFELGGDSIIAVHLFKKIKTHYNLDLGLSTIFEARTIRRLADVLLRSSRESQARPKNSRALVPIQPKGIHRPIYVISGLLGNVIKFHSLAFYLGQDQPMYGLLPRGLDGKEPYLTSIEEMAAYYVGEIRRAQPEGPYRLLGYSFGGIVAFEVAQQIVAQGGSVDLLGLLDTIEWHYLVKLQMTAPVTSRYTAYKAHLESLFEGKNRFQELKQLLAKRFSRVIYRIFRAIGRPLPQNVGTIADINAFAAGNYHPRPYPGKLAIFRSTIREASEENDQYLGWKGLAAGIEVLPVPSDHFNILQEPSVKILADDLRALLDSDSAQTFAREITRT